MSDLFSYPASPGFKERNGTSEQAANAMQGSARILRDRVFAALAREAMTADECAAKLKESILSIRPRFSELAKDNMIRRTGERRKNASGLQAAVWTINIDNPAAGQHDERRTSAEAVKRLCQEIIDILGGKHERVGEVQSGGAGDALHGSSREGDPVGDRATPRHADGSL